MSENKYKYDFTLDTAEKNFSLTGLASRVKPGQKILELGCSFGYLSKFLQEELGCDVVGVDIDAEAIEHAAPFCSKVIVADLDKADWLDEIKGLTFDVILCADVLEHLKSPSDILASLKSYLHNESRLLASVPNVAHSSIRLELLQGHFDYELLGLLDETHLHFYTRDGLIGMLMKAGYACSEIAYSSRDLADEVIIEHLANVGLVASEEMISFLHGPDAIAYQFIVEVRPAATELLQDLPKPLESKPLVTTGVLYSDYVEAIRNMEKTIQQQQGNISQLEKQYEAEKIHNKNYKNEIGKWQDTVEVIDNFLFDQAEGLARGKSENSSLQIRVEQLEVHLRDSIADRERLEQVLERVHNKLSYRLIRGIKDFSRKSKNILSQQSENVHNTVLDEQKEVDNVHDYTVWISKYGNLSAEQVSLIEEEIVAWQDAPKIAILMPVYNPEQASLENAIQSVLNQYYTNFELCIADDASTEPYVRQILQTASQQDRRIKIVFREQNGHISEASNSALALVDAEFVALMDHDDLLTPDALYWVAKEIKKNPDVQLIYSDEDKMDLQGQRYAPYFKPDWNPELFLSHNFICHLGVYKTKKIRSIGGFDSSFDGAQDYDLALRYVDQLSAEQIVHIPRILYHWRAVEGSTAHGVHEKPYAEEKIAKAVISALKNKQRPAEVIKHEKLPGTLRVRYLLPDKLPLVSIVIPTRNGFNLLHRCVESIFSKTNYANYELIIIDNGSDDFITLRYLQRLQHDNRVTVIRDKSPFNYSALNNKAILQVKGEIIALLNNDLEVINEDWLDEMVGFAQHSEVGAVGAKLYYPNDTIQHAGVIVGLGGVAGHSHKHFPRVNPGYCGRLLLTQNLTAVTAACLVLRKEVYNAVGGFDEKNLPVAFNDVDFCLRIREKGFLNVWTPYAEMYHYESATRGYEDTPEKQARFTQEVDYMQQRWGDVLSIDPAYNPNLTVEREDFSFAWPPRI